MRILILTAALLISESGSERVIGKICRYSSSCDSKTSYIYPRKALFCKDGFCQCNPEIEIRYSSLSFEASCDHQMYGMTLLMYSCNATSCGDDSNCVERQGSLFMRKNATVCVCKEGFLRLGTKCTKATLQNALQNCYVSKSGIFHACDVEEHSYCRDGKCICFDTYYANTTSKKCEPMDNVVKAYNLTKYAVKPNEYCTKNDHCIVGLVCKNFICTCPPPCNYNKTVEVCDCGEIANPSENLSGPILVGIILGFVIMMCWCHRIKKTIKKHGSKVVLTQNREGFNNLAEDDQNSASPGTHPLQTALGPPSAARSPHSASKGLGEVAPNKGESGDSLLDKTGGPLPPRASDYSFGTPQASLPSCSPSPIAPPTYTEMPSAGYDPPPYSLHPPQINYSAPYIHSSYDTSAALYPSSPSAPPYSRSSEDGPSAVSENTDSSSMRYHSTKM